MSSETHIIPAVYTPTSAAFLCRCVCMQSVTCASTISPHRALSPLLRQATPHSSPWRTVSLTTSAATKAWPASAPHTSSTRTASVWSATRARCLWEDCRPTSTKVYSRFFFIANFLPVRKLEMGYKTSNCLSDEITASFRRFGHLFVDWPHKAESKSYFPPKGRLLGKKKI